MTADKKRGIQLGGRLQWDYEADESKDAAGVQQTDTTDLDVRRARVFIKAIYDDFEMKAQFNIAESDGADGGNAEDLYIKYKGFGKLANITLGKQKTPFGLEELTSSKDITALERSAMTERYALGRAAGLSVSGKTSNVTYALGVFEADGDSGNDFDEKAYVGRVTFAPINSKTNVLHLGAGYYTQGVANGSDVDAMNYELAGTFGPFHAQAEFFDRDAGATSIDGYYVQVGYVITGETRPYKDGIFKRVKASGSSGAWEVVARYEDGDGRFSDIDLGRVDGEQTTIGLNYYMNSNVRLGLSYMDGEEKVSKSEGQELRLRAQFTF